MDIQDYLTEASLFYARNGDRKQRALVYRRFDQACEAIRFAVEDLAPRLLDSCTLEINDMHYLGRQIRPLYDDIAFPLQRRTQSTRQSARGSREDRAARGAPTARRALNDVPR
jgi:hypothetical protein